MIDDLVGRLRVFGDNPKERFISPNECFAMTEAADRIERLEEALKGTLYLFEAHAVSKTDLEQIRFARAALAGDKP